MHTVKVASLLELMGCFNHSTQRQTLDYLCIQEAAIRYPILQGFLRAYYLSTNRALYHLDNSKFPHSAHQHWS